MGVVSGLLASHNFAIFSGALFYQTQQIDKLSDAKMAPAGSGMINQANLILILRDPG